jgi:two-component system cell cycle response regulator
MTTLVQAALTLRRSARGSFGYATALIVFVLSLLGVTRVTWTAIGPEHVVVLVAWFSVVMTRAAARIQQSRNEKQTAWLDLELGLLSLAGFHSILQLFGGLTSEVYPLLYVLIAFFSSFADRRAGRALVLFAVGAEAALYFVTEGHTDPRPFALHAIFLTAFGLLSVIFTQAEISRVRMQSKRELSEERERVRHDARLFRLVGAPTDGTAHDEEKLLRSSIEQVHHSLFYLLDLLKRTLGLHSAVLLLKDDSGDQLRISELVTESDDIAEGTFRTGGGAVGGAAARGTLVNLEHIKPGYGGICYYRGPAIVRAFMAVPVEEGGHLRGALCVDRVDDRPFTPAEEAIVHSTVGQLLRAMENERVFGQLERSKREHAILHQASQALGAAMTEEAVLDAGLKAAAQIAGYDFAAITQYDPESRKHSVRRAVGEGADVISNLSFRDNTSLTAMAVKNRHYLPYRGDFDAEQQTVYTRNANLRGMQSLLILPLCVRDEATGTMALAARAKDAFGSSVRPALQVLANQLAVALSNAASVRRLEELATTDGLTGCFNKRYFMEELERRLVAAERFKRNLSLVIADIDHFKAVNDTYGHATGDVVIRELGQILMRLKRETDLVARFGGEEFCILCEETDTGGAMQLAERVREELMNTVFQTEMGKLKVTCSLGVATFPLDAKDKGALFEASDRALYAAKHGGRNQVRTART